MNQLNLTPLSLALVPLVVLGLYVSRNAWSITLARPRWLPAATNCAMATQMLNADAPLVSIQDLLGHNWIMTTQRYCKVSNVKVQRDYHQAMERIVSRYRERETS